MTGSLCHFNLFFTKLLSLINYNTNNDFVNNVMKSLLYATGLCLKDDFLIVLFTPILCSLFRTFISYLLWIVTLLTIESELFYLYKIVQWGLNLAKKNPNLLIYIIFPRIPIKQLAHWHLWLMEYRTFAIWAYATTCCGGILKLALYHEIQFSNFVPY